MNQWERNKDLDKQNSDSQTREQLPEKVLSFICNSGPPLESQPLSDARHQCPAKVKRALNEFLLLKAPPPAISQAGGGMGAVGTGGSLEEGAAEGVPRLC
ncbi:hypothetical protein CapIbe_009158 [Capra ibex]